MTVNNTHLEKSGKAACRPRWPKRWRPPRLTKQRDKVTCFTCVKHLHVTIT